MVARTHSQTSSQLGIPCLLMRGGTSKGGYFLASDLPADVATRDRVLLAAFGSPDPRQIDGVGGADSLTSKIAVISPPTRPDADIDYLFLQVVVAEPRVDASQNCGNILAGVGPFAIERGLVPPAGDLTPVRIHMVNTGSIAIAHVPTLASAGGGCVQYSGDARIDGVPGTAAAIMIDFLDVAGGSCGALLPTGRVRDKFEGVDVTCIDNGMPVVLVSAADLGVTGGEAPIALETDARVKARVDAIRLAAGRAMNLGDVTAKTVPKVSLISAPTAGGVVSTRTFIPHKVHDAIGVFGAVSVATACLIPGSVADGVADLRRCAKSADGTQSVDVEHPTGFFTVAMTVGLDAGGAVRVERSALLRTARKIMAGHVYVPHAIWNGAR
jgi:4-oxalomesaconate tautomerase